METQRVTVIDGPLPPGIWQSTDMEPHLVTAPEKNSSLALTQMAELVEGASHIISFRLEKGHPFYPVFWDFAFSIEKNEDVFVFIGSSSD